MESTIDTRSIAILQRASRFCCYAVGLIACITLAGWITGFQALSNFGSGVVATAVSTAGCLVLCAFSIHVLSSSSANSLLQRMASIFAGFVGGIAVFVLFTYAAQWENAGQLLGPGFTAMAALTALCFLLLSGAILTRDFANGTLAITLATMGGVLSGLDLIGYAYGIEELQRVLPFSAMALPTAISLLILFTAFLLAYPAKGWIRYAVRRDRVGTLFRLLLPVAILAPFMFGLAVVLSVDYAWFNLHFALASFAMASSVILGVIVVFLSAWLAYADDQRRRSEDALWRNSELLQSAMGIAQLGAFTANLPLLPETKVDLTPEAARILNLDPAKFDGTFRSYADFIHPEDLPGQAEYGRRVHETREPRRITYRIAQNDGSYRWIEQQANVLQDDDGTPLLFMAVIKDVTDARIMEQQLVQAQKMDAIGNLTGGMAHDFNNLLGVIIGNLDLLRMEVAKKPETAELVDDALDAASRGADLTKRLLAFARRQPLQPVVTEPNALVSNIVKLLRRTLGEAVEVKLDLSADIENIIVDPIQLEASIANLATNARDAMPRGGDLIIATANKHLDEDYAAAHPEVVPGPYVMIEVSDNGTGMPPDIMSRVFEPFFTTKEQGKGTGLGLSMVFGFIKQSGGHINVYSEPDVGTTFRLYLPRAKSGDAVNMAPAAPASSSGGHEIILVVEDNEAMRRVVVRQLTEMGYRVIEASSGAEGRDILKSRKVDLLFTDVVMPGELDGLDLARIAQDEYPETKVLLTSGFPEAKLNGRGAAITGLRLLSKPYRREDLAQILREVLG